MPRYGGKISSEWMLAKALQILEEAPEIYTAADRITEAADWVIWQLSGVETCNTCTAGYKANFQDGHYPSSEFLGALNPGFANFAKDKLISKLDALGARVGGLTAQASSWTGLPEDIAVAVANVDAHVAVPAANAVQPGQMVLIMGTSTCHIMNGETLAEVPGMCGVVDGGVSPGMFGYEAGQSGVGDIFGWFVKNGVPPEYHDAAREAGMDIHAYLTSLAEKQAPGEHGLIGLLAGCAPHCHQFIAHIIHQHALVIDDAIGELSDDFADPFHGDGRIEALTDAAEIANIAKQERHFGVAALEHVGVRGQSVGEFRSAR